MGQKNGKLTRSESGVASDDGFSDDEMPEIIKNKKALMNPFLRQLINDCYAQAHKDLTARILHRCSQQRHDFKDFLDALGQEGKAALREGLKCLIEDVISKLDDEEAVKRVSRSYGRAQVPLRHCGHKPDFFATVADAIATECVFVSVRDVSAATPTNTFKAWTVLVGVMFTAVRDGYYTELRRSRKASPGGLEGERTLASSKHSSVDSSSSNGDRPSPSVSSRGSPHFTRSSKSIEASSVQQPTTVITVTAPTSNTGSAARRAYKGSRSAAVVGSDGATSSRSCDAICGEDQLQKQQQQHRDYRLPPQHRSHDLLRADSPRTDGRFKKNVSLDYDKRRQRLEEIGKKHSNGYLARNPSCGSGSVFDPNRIMDAFMNDEPF